MKYLFFLLFLIISLTNVIAQNKRISPIIKHITKPLIIPFLLLYYSRSKCPEDLLILGLLFGWLGDVFIIFHHRMKTKVQYNIYPITCGLGAFFIGHLFYLSLFRTSQFINLPLIMIYFAIFVSTTLTMSKIGILSKNNDTLKKRQKLILKIAITIYTLTILSMSYFSFKVNMLVFAGSLCFLLSDTILSLKEFGQLKLPEEWVMITYVAAQFLIVIGYM